MSIEPIIPATAANRGLDDAAARAGRLKGGARHKPRLPQLWTITVNFCYPLCLIFIFIMLLFIAFWIPPTAPAVHVAVFWQVLGKC